MTKTYNNINAKNLLRYLKDTGQTLALMKELCGITDGIGSDREQPCPLCGGDDRFRYNADCDRFFCRKCKATGWDAIALVMEARNIKFIEAIRLVAETCGYDSAGCSADIKTETKQTKQTTFETLPFDKHSPDFKKAARYRPDIGVTDFKRAEARLCRNGIAIPQYINDGTLSGYVRYLTDGSKKNSPGSKSGIVGKDVLDALLCKQPAKIVFKTAGVSDCLVLNGQFAEARLANDFYAFTTGGGEMENPDKFDSILRPALEGKNIAIIADNDDTGEKGARKWAAFFVPFTRSVRIIRLPKEVYGSPVKDLRDYIAKLKENDDDVIEALTELYNSANIITSEVVAKQCRQFPIDVFPRMLRRYVKEVAKSIGMDCGNAAASILVALSGMIGRTFQIEQKRGHTEYAILWVAVVAHSAGAKTPAIKHACEPMYRLQIEAEERYNRKMEAYEAREKKEQTKKNRGLAACVKPLKPTRERYIVSDTTTEGLYPILGENPYGVTGIVGELAAFLYSLDMYRGKGGDMQKYIQIHDGTPVMIDRKGDRAHIFIKTPAVSIIGGIQQSVVREIVQKNKTFFTSGFGARFLFVHSIEKPLLNDYEVSDESVSLYSDLFTKIVSYRKSHQGQFSPDAPGIVRLSQEAWKLYKDFHNQKRTATPSEYGSDIDTVLVKAAQWTMRLALVLHIVWCAAQDKDPLTPVTPGLMQHALDLTEWFLKNTIEVYAMLDGKAEPTSKQGLTASDEDIILAKIRELGRAATVHDLRPKMSSTSKYRQPDGVGTTELYQKLEEMVKAGLLTRRYDGRKDLYCIPADTDEK